MARKNFNLLFGSSGVGAVAVAQSLRALKPSSRLTQIVLGRASWLMIIAVLVVLSLPAGTNVPLNRTGLRWVLAIFFIYVLLLAIIARTKPLVYELSVFRGARIAVNLLVITALVWFSSGQDSYFWFFYALPVLQSIFYFSQAYIWLITAIALLGYYSAALYRPLPPAVPLDIARLGINTLFLVLMTFMLDFLYRTASTNAAALREESEKRERELKRQACQQEALNRLSQAIDSAASLRDALQTALEQGLQAIDVRDGSIMLLDPETGTPLYRAWLVNGEFMPEKSHHLFRPNEGIVGYVIATGRPYVYRRGTSDPYFTPSASGRPIGSLICVPILAYKRVIGVINADNPKIDYFGKSDVEFLVALASQVAIAIEAHRLRDLGLLLNTFDLETLTEHVVENAAILTGAEHSTLFLVDEVTGDLKRVRNHPKRRKTAGNPRRDGLSSYILQTGEPIVIPDAQNDPRVKRETKHEGIRSIMGVPLKRRAFKGQIEEFKCFGVLWVNSKISRNWSPRDRKLLEGLAGHAAVAYSNARLFNQTRHRYQALSELHEIALELTRYQRQSKLMDSILKRAVGLFDAAGGGLYLLDPNENTLTLVATSKLTEKLRWMTIPLGNSVAGRVVQTKQPFTVQDYRHWPDRLAVYDEFDFTAIAGAPIIWQGRGEEKVLGAITVRHVAENRRFSQEELDLLIHLGHLAAIGLENARQGDALERLFDSAPYAIIEVNNAGEVLRCNIQAEQLLGRSKSKLLGYKVRTLYDDPDEAAHIQKLLTSSATNGRITDRETRVHNRAGDIIPIRLSATLLYDHQEKPSGSVGFFRDQREIEDVRRKVRQLTNLLKASRAISEERELRAWLDAILLAAVELLGAEGGALYLTDEHQEQVIRVAQYNLSDELLEKTFPIGESVVGQVIKSKQLQFIHDYRHWSYRLQELDTYNLTNVVGAPISYQDRIWGAIIVHSVEDRPELRKEDRNYLEVLGQLAGVALQADRRRNDLEKVLSCAFDSVITVDGSGRITQFNTRAEEILGYRAADVLGMNLTVLPLYVDPGEARTIQRLLEENGGRISGYETAVQTRNGEIIPIILSAALLPAHWGQRTGSVGFFQDARRWKEVQYKIRQLEDSQERLNFALVLLARWGHKAKNNIFTLQQELATLKKLLPERILEYSRILHNMEACVDKLSYPSNHLLEDSEEVLQQKSDLNDVGQLLVNVAELMCEESYVPVDLEGQDIAERKLEVQGSRMLLETAFELLVENALEAIESKGLPGTLKLEGTRSNGWVTLAISDTGPGISPTVAGRLFQGPVPSTMGFGYGSWVVATILRSLRGDIIIGHTGPEGTRIELKLPAASSAPLISQTPFNGSNRNDKH